MVQVVFPQGLDDLVVALQRSGRTVIAPVVRDGVISHEPIESAVELPVGWTDDQRPGSYRLVATGTDERFGFSSPSTSWKRFVYPERTLMIRAHREGRTVSVEPPALDTHPLAFFGVRSCDLAALGVLDKVFDDPDATDPHYHARRADVFVVAVACARPGNNCFCASMGTGPTPREGFDLSVSEIRGAGGLEYLVEAGTDRGEELLAGLSSRDATHADQAVAAHQHDEAVSNMGRQLASDDPPDAARHLDHPRWEDVAGRCLACGNCTMVCPTCFCSRMEDTTDLAGTHTERWRVWDSCFTLDFSYLHGGSVRDSTMTRYRQWLLHKLVTWHDQYDTSGCVGCGRCITWCPVGIDITEEIAALAADPSQPAVEGSGP